MRGFVFTRTPSVVTLTALIALAALLIAIGPSSLGAQDAEADFKANCALCHTIGGGAMVGPDLKDVAGRKDRQWLVQFVNDPVGVIESGDAYAVQLRDKARGALMVTVPGMTEERASGLLDYIEAESQRLQATTAKAPSLKVPPVTPRPVKAPPVKPLPAHIPIRQADPSVAYLGRDSCRECHQENFATFSKTGMGRSFYPMSADNIIEDFTERNELTDPRSGVRYRMFERDGKYYQRQYLLDSDRNEIAVDEYELTYVVGSGNHGRGYVTLRDGKLFQAPACWDPTKEFWMLCPGFEINNEHFGREISASCSFCHNGRMELVEGERNLYHEPIAMGIGCERCHGPGERHVATQYANKAAGRQAALPDPTIVNPARLPPVEREHVCFQCHLGDTSATVRVRKRERALNDFRPGMPITEILVPFRYKQQTVASFGLVAQADRMIQSRCYLESDGKLECLTCHNPHIPVYERPKGSFRANCMTCHEQQACTASGDRRSATDPPDDCVACHMRRAEPSDRKNSIFTDHWIRRDALDPAAEPRTDFDLEPVFPEVLASYPEGERAYYWGRAHFLWALNSSLTARAEHWARGEEAFRKAIDRDYGFVETWFFLGKIQMYQERHAEALASFRQALKQDPAHRDAKFAAAQSLAALGQYEQASLLFTAMIELDPGDALALAELARMRWVSREFEGAVELYRRAVEQEPWNPKFRFNLGMSLASLGRMGEAADQGMDAARLNPDSAEVWGLVFNASREAGRVELQREARLQLDRLASADPGGLPAEAPPVE